MDTTLKVGDVVTWRDGGNPKAKGGTRNIPIGIANCRVMEFGIATDGRDAAWIKLPPQMGGENVAAAVADLYIDD